MKLSSFFTLAKVCIAFFYKVSTAEILMTSGATDFVKVLDFDDPISSSGTVLVQVKAATQAVLWLGETSDPGNGGVDQASSYGITLGGWNNTRSIINGGYFHSDLAVYEGDTVLTEDDFSSFSLSWNKDVLKVERYDDESEDWVELMEISDRESDGYNYDIKHLIVGWGEESAEWTIGQPRIWTSGPTNFVKVLDFDGPISSSGKVLVTVKTTKQAVLWLGETSDPGNGGVDQASSYGITLGGWDNTQSIINGGYFHSELAVYEGDTVLGDWTTFSLSWNKDVLKVERYDDESEDWFELMEISNRESDGYNHDIKHLIVGWGDEEALWNIGQPSIWTPTSSICSDDTSWRYAGKSSKHCGWVYFSPSKRCSKRSAEGVPASEACPIACGDLSKKTCDIPKCNDDSWFHWFRNEKSKGCNDYLNQRVKRRCRNLGVTALGNDPKFFAYEYCSKCSGRGGLNGNACVP